MSPQPVPGKSECQDVLPHSEERWQALFENCSIGIATADAAGRCVAMNSSFRKLLGLAKEDLPAACKLFTESIEESSVNARVEKYCLRKDSSPIWLNVTVSLIPGTERMSQFLIALVEEITERKRAEEALRQSEECFRLLVEGVQEYAIYMLDPGGLVRTWNAGAERIIGYKAEEILGQHFCRFYEGDDIAKDKPQQTLEVAASAERFEGEGWRVRKDGSRFWAKVTVTPIRDNDAKLLGFSKVTRDLTEHKRFEQELKHERDRLRLLLDLNNSFASNLDLHQVFQVLSTRLRSVMRSDAAVLSLPDLTPGKVRVYAIDFPASNGFLKEGFVHPIEGSLVGPALRTAKPFLFSGIPAWLTPKLQDLLAKEGLKSGCTLPLIRDGSVLGVLSLGCLTENAFPQQDVDLLEQVAGQVAIAVENALRYHQVTESKERLEEEKLYLEDEIRRERGFGELVGKSRGLKRVLKNVETVAATDAAVLILGETGTGKELIARAIHNLSPRRDHALVRADCASIPGGLLESELFGHEKGAFTGAISRNIGRIELAHRGTLFLDEVGDIPLELQSKLLRVLQEQELERLGSSRTVLVDFRLVAATNRDLNGMVEQGQFRRDLYYRLNVFPLEVPPLRDRVEDIPLLVWHFVKKYARRMNKRIEEIRPEDMEALTQYHWPGNVRELQNVVERSMVSASGAILNCSLVAELHRIGRNPKSEPRTLAEAERGQILAALRETDWVVGGPDGAAARLGVKRTTLLDKMRRHRISRALN